MPGKIFDVNQIISDIKVWQAAVLLKRLRKGKLVSFIASLKYLTIKNFCNFTLLKLKNTVIWLEATHSKFPQKYALPYSIEEKREKIKKNPYIFWFLIVKVFYRWQGKIFL